MKFEEYAARFAQEQPETLKAQEAMTIDELSAKLESEKLISLLAQVEAALDAGGKPARVLNAIITAIFGADSPQAAQAAKIIDAESGGHEMAIAGIRCTKQLLRKRRKALEDQIAAIDAELSRLDTEETELKNDSEKAAALDAGLIEVLTFAKSLKTDPQPDLLQSASDLFDRYRGNAAALGLLYGSISKLSIEQYETIFANFVDRQEYTRLKEKLAAALAG